jgi:DnaD and phage-associated domain
MNYIKEKIKDFYLLDSKVENIFINEYMPEAPGDYVKVFIYAQMYAEYGLDMSNETMAKQLGITEKKVLDAWTYWEKIGAVRKHYIDNSGDVEFTVEFLNLKEFLYGKNRTPVPAAEESKSEDNIFGNENVKKMFSEVEKKFGRGLSSTEISTIMSWLTDYSATPEVVLYGVDYCVQKNKLSIRYIETIIRKWTELGLNTVDQVADYLHQMDERFYQYKRVLNALGFTRNATEAEKRMMDNWFDGMGFSMDRVLDR